jgi:hypothetical protein
MQNAEEFSESVQPQYIRKHKIYAFCPSSQTEILVHSLQTKGEGKWIYLIHVEEAIYRDQDKNIYA